MNFYLQIDDPIGQSKTTIHIGKDSPGWEFSFRGYDGLSTLSDWESIIRICKNTPGMRIIDHAGNTVSSDALLRLIERSKNTPNLINIFRYRKKHGFSLDGWWIDESGFAFTKQQFC